MQEESRAGLHVAMTWGGEGCEKENELYSGKCVFLCSYVEDSEIGGIMSAWHFVQVSDSGGGWQGSQLRGQ